MKKIFTSITVLFSLSLFSQSSLGTFGAYRMNQTQTSTVQALTNGGIRSESTIGSTPLSFFVKLVNLSTTTTLTLSVKRAVIFQNPPLKLDGLGNTPDTYFCFGNNCFQSNVNAPTSSDYCPLLINGATATVQPKSDNSQQNGTPFVIYLNEDVTVGKYFVMYTLYDIANTSDSLSFTVKYNEFLSVEENTSVLESVGNVYPNPSTNVANFNVVLKQQNPVKIEVFNSLGSLLQSNAEQKLNGVNQISVDCTKFQSGLYFVTVTAGNSKVTKRLVINK